MREKSVCVMNLILLLVLVGNASADLVAHYEFDTDVSDTAGHATGPFKCHLMKEAARILA